MRVRATAVQTASRSCLMLAALICAAGLLTGCVLLPPTEDEAVVTTAYDHVLPVGWHAISDWIPVNLDADEEEEHLLLFRFDGGQVGAQIVEGNPATTISPPVRLLPRIFDDTSMPAGSTLGRGVIAPPGTPATAITVTQVSGAMPARELVILGNGTHLTFAWWRGTSSGYGVTQLVALGGFGVNWETWFADPMPFSTVMGYTPLEDYRARANICAVTQYTRRTDLPPETPAISFRTESLGLHFCGSTIPPHPYAPEGVVLAYLKWPRADTTGLTHLLTPGTTLAQLDVESAAERWPLERVADIAAYPSVPVTQAYDADMPPPTTTVCVEFAEISNPNLRRWLVYTLRYQPPDAQQRLPERWTVSGAFHEPPPLELPPPGYCATILARNAP